MSPPRMFLPGMSHHVWHRGNNRADVFVDDCDRIIFLMLLGRAAKRSDLQIHGYVLMGTHYHALVTAPDQEALPRTMQRLGRGYSRYFNERHGRTGTLWEGRYQASLIVDERRWLTCLRYIELNPVEARMVSSPDAYRWSSYQHHGLGQADPLLTSHPLLGVAGHSALQQQAEWRALCGQEIRPEERALILAALRSNRPLHDPGFDDTAAVQPDASLVVTGT